MNTSTYVPGTVQSTWRVAWPFWISLAIFLAATVIDSGRSHSRVLGQSPGSLATVLMILCGLANVQGKTFGAAAGATLLILALVAVQVLFQGESVTAAYSLVGSMAVAWVVALQRADSAFVFNLMKTCLVLFGFLAVSFYLGMWRHEEGVMSFPQMNRNIVALELVFGATLTMTLGRQGQLGKFLERAWPIAVVLFVVPIVFTASRKGIVAVIALPAVYFSLVKREMRAMRFVAAIAILGLVVFGGVYEYAAGSAGPLDHVISRFEAGDSLRTNFARLGLDLVLAEPLLGYGITAPHDPVWMAGRGFVDDFTGVPVAAHNGLLVYALMGGIPLLALYLIFLGSTMFKLASMPSSLPAHRETCAGAIVLMLVVLITLVGGGNAEFWKLGWLIIGMAMLVLDVVKREAQV